MPKYDLGPGTRANHLVTSIRSTGENCIDIPIDNLISRPDWGSINFRKAQAYVELIFDIVDRLIKLPIQKLPENVLDSVSNCLIRVEETINKIKNFNIDGGGNPADDRNSIIQDLKEQTHDLFARASPPLTYLASRESNLSQNAEGSIAEVETLYAYIQGKAEEIDTLFAGAKNASGSIGVIPFAENFSEVASELKQSARKWLTVGIVLGMVTLIVASIFLLHGEVLNGGNGYAMAQWITSKLVILGLLISAIAWCGRIYKTLMHQATVNRHRADSIQTFEEFTNAANSDAMRDAVLMATTRAIFDKCLLVILMQRMIAPAASK